MGTGTIAGAAGNNRQLRGQLMSLNQRVAALEVQPGLTDMCIRVNSQ